MKYFIDSNNGRHGLEEDGSQDFLIQEDWEPIPDEVIQEELEKSNPNSFINSQLALINKVNVKVNKDIISGFTSTALVTEHWYKSTQQDQTNLNQIATANINVKLQISEDNITFIEQEHTAKQIKQVNADCAKHITNTLSKGRELKDLVRLATTKEELIELEKQLA